MQVPDDCKTVLQLFVKLWSQSFASQIFALLFYQWVSFISFLEYDHRKRRNKFYVIFIGKLRLCDIFGKMLRGILYWINWIITQLHNHVEGAYHINILLIRCSSFMEPWKNSRIEYNSQMISPNGSRDWMWINTMEKLLEQPRKDEQYGHCIISRGATCD